MCHGGNVENFENFMELLPKEINKNIIAMSKTDDIEKRRIYSEIILNLCQSMGIFIDAFDTMDVDSDDDLDFDEPYPDKAKKRRKKGGNDNDIPF